jgi:hypothetical protein
MTDRRSDESMSDAWLAHEIEQALAVDPSPGFVARVRVRIGSEPQAAKWRLPWSVLVVASTGAAALVLLLGTGQHKLNDRGLAVLPVIPARPLVASFGLPLQLTQGEVQPLGADFKAVISGRASTENAANTEATSAASNRKMAFSNSRRQRTSQNAGATSPLDPEVLIAADEALALQRLMRGVQGRAAAIPLGDRSTDIVALEPLKEIVVAPLMELPPLAITPPQ